MHNATEANQSTGVGMPAGTIHYLFIGYTTRQLCVAPTRLYTAKPTDKLQA
jgi:hypothetical protein